jgi:hypothetical protein
VRTRPIRCAIPLLLATLAWGGASAAPPAARASAELPLSSASPSSGASSAAGTVAAAGVSARRYR